MCHTTHAASFYTTHLFSAVAYPRRALIFLYTMCQNVRLIERASIRIQSGWLLLDCRTIFVMYKKSRALIIFRTKFRYSMSTMCSFIQQKKHAGCSDDPSSSCVISTIVVCPTTSSPSEKLRYFAEGSSTCCVASISDDNI